MRTPLVLVLLFSIHSLAIAVTGPVAQLLGGDTVDLGRVRPGRLDDTVMVVNAGDDTLRLGAMSSGCGCLAGAPDRSVLVPGDTARVVVTIETSGSVAETFDKVLNIATNDPRRPVVSVRIRARLARDVRVESLLNTVQREPCPQDGCVWEIELANASDGAITIYPPVMEEVRGLRVEIDDPRTIELAAGARVVIRARVRPADGEGVPMARLLFLTSSPNDPEVRASFFFAMPAAR